MTRMKHILTVLALLVAFASCNERPAVVRDTIPYVKQLATDTTGTFRLVRAYRSAGTKGSIAVIGEPEAALRRTGCPILPARPSTSCWTFTTRPISAWPDPARTASGK